MPVSGAWLRGQIEGEFPAQAVSALPKVQAIVVLGGAVVPPAAGHPFVGLSDAADRVWHASRLYHGGRAPLLA